MGSRENDVYSKRGVPEAQAAMDFMKRRGCDRLVLGGLCSGAYVAYHTAVADPRVAGILMINPLTFHWKEGDSLEIRTRKTFKSTRFYSKALLDRETWKRAFAGDVQVRAVMTELAGRLFVRGRGAAIDWISRVTGVDLDASDIARGFRAIAKRGSDCILVFGADDGGVDVMEEHLGTGGRKMRGVPHFRLEIIEGPDHTFTPLWSQKLLRELLTDHLVRTYR
jgi:pimeloyl-ACP methyl ester carboxylesterase